MIGYVFRFASDGVHFITATTAPRMQVGNLFRVWDFTGTQIHEWTAAKHLFGVVPFLRDPPPPFPEEKVDNLTKQLGNKPAVRGKLSYPKIAHFESARHSSVLQFNGINFPIL